MNEVVTSKTEPGKKLSVGLQSRLLYLLLKCPMLQNRGQGCACGEQDDIEAEAIAADDFAGCTAARGRRQHADDEEVVLQVKVPYALRRAAGQRTLIVTGWPQGSVQAIKKGCP